MADLTLYRCDCGMEMFVKRGVRARTGPRCARLIPAKDDDE
jgi:hypothetical protein